LAPEVKLEEEDKLFYYSFFSITLWSLGDHHHVW